jgi:hypothetical protein
MRAAFTTLATAAILSGSIGCAPGDDAVTDVGRRDDARTEDAAEVDAAPEAGCASNAECDDLIECTQDVCRAGGICGHTALDVLCAAGERCSETVGCTAEDCTSDDQCSDGVFCNGVELCVGGACFANPDGRDCSDGNVCTDDRCDADLDRCVHDFVPGEGCESDAADGAGPFDPLVHYAGDFLLAPTQSQACGVTYSIDSVSFSRSDTELQVFGPPCALRQAPPPSGAEFAVSCTQGCGTYSLSGTFSDSDNFAGRWTASFSGCPSCSNQDVAVIGTRL